MCFEIGVNYKRKCYLLRFEWNTSRCHSDLFVFQISVVGYNFFMSFIIMSVNQLSLYIALLNYKMGIKQL